MSEIVPMYLVEGLNPHNRLQDDSDLWYAFMDICINVQFDGLDHLDAADRLSQAVDVYLSNNGIDLRKK